MSLPGNGCAKPMKGNSVRKGRSLPLDAQVAELVVGLDEVRALQHGQHAPVGARRQDACSPSALRVPSAPLPGTPLPVRELHVGELAGQPQQDVDDVVAEPAAVLQAVGRDADVGGRQREVDAQHVGDQHLAEQVRVGVAEVRRQQQRHAVRQGGHAERRRAARRGPAIVLPVPSLSVVVSASGMYWLTLRASSAGTERLNGVLGRAGDEDRLEDLVAHALDLDVAARSRAARGGSDSCRSSSGSSCPRRRWCVSLPR